MTKKISLPQYLGMPNKSLTKSSRRKFIKDTAILTAAASTLPLFNINHAWSQEVVFDGEPFDAGGAELKLGSGDLYNAAAVT